MQKPYDLMAKGLLEGTLRGPCEVRVEEQVVADARAIDTLVVPDPRRLGELSTRGLLGRMALHVCAIEAFHDPPDTDLVNECLLKVLAFDARRRTAWRSIPPSQRGAAIPYTRLWVVSAGDPVRALQRMARADRTPSPAALRLTSSLSPAA